MLHSTFDNLGEGDLVKRIGDTAIYIVHGNYGNYVTAVRTVNIIKEAEWVLVYKATHKLVVFELEDVNGDETK